jgi:hypothetical protein
MTAIDTEIRKHFLRVCKLDDCLLTLERNGKDELTVMASLSSKKRKSSRAVEQELPLPQSTLVTDSVYERRMLGMYLGRRLHAKYSNAISSMLMGSDGYAILNLVPGPPSSFWKTRKKKLLSLFRKEIEPYLGSIEAIQPTFRQVHMRKIDNMLLDGPDAPPLTSSFFKALKGIEGTLFPFHVFQSLQLLETSAGIPVVFPPEMKEKSKKAQLFEHQVPVLLQRKRAAKVKKALVKECFLEPDPHLVCSYACSVVVVHLIIHCMSIIMSVWIYRTMTLHS